MPLIQRFFNAPYGRCSFSTLAYELAMKTESRSLRVFRAKAQRTESLLCQVEIYKEMGFSSSCGAESVRFDLFTLP